MVRSCVQACDLSMRSTPFWIVPLSSAPLIVSWPLATSEEGKEGAFRGPVEKGRQIKADDRAAAEHGGHGPLGGAPPPPPPRHGVPVEAGPFGGQ